MGAWVLLPMPAKQGDRMQAVHIALLPDNKVLIANGSSNRNRLTPQGKVEDGVDTTDYAVINNTSIFDPSLSDPYYQGKSLVEADFTTPPFTRISSPPAELSGEPNDLFCSGHLHLPNGDVLLYGGIVGIADISFGPGKYAIEGASISASLERWKAPLTAGGKGEWEIDKDFLARIDDDILQDSTGIAPDGKVQAYPLKYAYVKQSSKLGRYGKRAMEQAVILPTKQVLVVNGGNYAEHRPMYNPTLLTDRLTSKRPRTSISRLRATICCFTSTPRGSPPMPKWSI
jgi:hypothetical protein